MNGLKLLFLVVPALLARLAICDHLSFLLQDSNYTETGLKVHSPGRDCVHEIKDSLAAFSAALPPLESCGSVCIERDHYHAVDKFQPAQACIDYSKECGPNDTYFDRILPGINKFITSFHDSCQSILSKDSSSVSGYYIIRTGKGDLNKVYCDMEGVKCGGVGGWTRIGYINMTESPSTCPFGLSPITYSNLDHQLCNKVEPGLAGCNSAFFSSLNITYTKVCGRARGYQFRSPDGFHPTAGISVNSIDGVYLDGVSITHGSNPRKHIWSLAGGLTEGVETYWHCPCNTNSYHSVPSFVGSDYYCESGVGANQQWQTVLYPDDPLWDGQDCNGSEGPCCTAPNMPWFVKSLDQQTSDDIELRMCSSQSHPDTEGTPLELVELFIR